jgi:circadian clock protein KaiB
MREEPHLQPSGEVPAKTSQERYTLRLYVSGATPCSTRAIENVRVLCEEHLPGRYDLEVVDIYQQPGLAEDDGILAAPTLVRRLPLPLRRLVGDLSDTERVLGRLNLYSETCPIS